MARSIDPWNRVPDMRFIKGFEGGGVYAAEQDGKAYVIENESAMADLLIPGEDNGLIATLVRVGEFATVEERDAHLRRRGWIS